MPDKNAAKGPDALRKSFDAATDALKTAASQPAGDERQINLATSLIMDLERRVMRLPDPEDREQWRSQLDDLQQQLQDAAAEYAGPSPGPSGAAAAAVGQSPAGPQEGGGDIDDLFSGMALSDSSKKDKTAGDEPHKGEFVPQAVPGRRYMRVVRPGAAAPGHVTRVSPAAAAAAARGQQQPAHLQDAHDVAGQGKEDVEVESDDEAARYKPQTQHPPTSERLRVELPDMPLAEAAAAAGAASHGSADSTMARGGEGATNGSEESDDESITSPEHLDEVSSFK